MTSAEHEELRQRLGVYVLGALTPAEHAELQAHLTGCADCAAEVRAMQQSADALALVVEPIDPPPALRQRILSSIAPSAVAPVAPRTDLSASRAGLPWLAAAAALALAVGLGGYATQLRGRVQALEQQLREAVSQLLDGERQMAQARLVAADAQRQLSVLAAPDVAHVDLKGQVVAPQASARALWSRSRGLLFAASNLPPLPAGRTYQLWVISGRLAPISDGWVFKTDSGGAVTTMFTTPLTLPAPTAMAVTIEPEGGTRAPTGTMYLVGSLN
jgi:anti-sigma-K factor RskA